MLSTDNPPKDPVIEQIKTLYELGEGGQYEIIQRVSAVSEALLMMGKSGKYCVDFHMDKGVKPLELGLSLTIALQRVEDEFLSKIDIELKKKIFSDPKNLEMLAEWQQLEEQNEPKE